jgi:L-lactate utilization protein LutB
MASEGAAVSENTRGFNRGRYESVGRLPDCEGLKDEARAIKADAIERLPELIEQLRTTVEDNGGTVYLAEDAADANEYIRSVVAERDASRVVKSKSMTFEEIDVNERSRGAASTSSRPTWASGCCRLPTRRPPTSSRRPSTGPGRASRTC